MIDPALQQLRQELEQLGMVVVPHGDHICVRLPLLTSVHVSLERGVLRCEPRLGPLPRSSTLAGTATATASSVAVAAIAGLPLLPLVLATGGLAALGVQLGGFMLAESCITRVQLLWSRVREQHERPAIAAATRPSLQEPIAPELDRAVRIAEHER